MHRSSKDRKATNRKFNRFCRILINSEYKFSKKERGKYIFEFHYSGKMHKGRPWSRSDFRKQSHLGRGKDYWNVGRRKDLALEEQLRDLYFPEKIEFNFMGSETLSEMSERWYLEDIECGLFDDYPEEEDLCPDCRQINCICYDDPETEYQDYFYNQYQENYFNDLITDALQNDCPQCGYDPCQCDVPYEDETFDAFITCEEIEASKKIDAINDPDSD